MKNFLLSLFLLISVTALAQEPIGVPTQNYNGTWARFGQYLSIDKGLLIPARDTNWIPKRAGALTFWGADFWGYNGQQWKLVGTNVTQQVPADTTTTWIYFDRRYFKGEATIPSPITLSDSLLALINSRGTGGTTDISGKADKTTTLTINGTTYDLSANRSWTIATGGGGVATDTTSLSNRINQKTDKATTITINGTTFDLSQNRSWTIAAGVTAFNTRTGAIVPIAADYAAFYASLSHTHPESDIVNLTTDLAGKVNTATTITINGVTYDLSQNRSWTISTGQNLSQVTATGNTTATDIEITDATKGVILKSPDGTRWRLTVNNDGTITTTSL